MDIGLPVLLALIPTIASLAAAFFSFQSAQASNDLKSAADEKGKRSEVLRLQGLKAIDELLGALASQYIIALTVQFWSRAKVDPSVRWKNIYEGLDEFNKERPLITRIRIQSSPYLTPKIVEQIDQLLGTIDDFLVQPDKFSTEEIDTTVNRLKDLADGISNLARDTYLKTDLDL